MKRDSAHEPGNGSDKSGQTRVFRDLTERGVPVLTCSKGTGSKTAKSVLSTSEPVPHVLSYGSGTGYSFFERKRETSHGLKSARMTLFLSPFQEIARRQDAYEGWGDADAPHPRTHWLYFLKSGNQLQAHAPTSLFLLP
jgi:hypothetical protein